MKRNFIFLVLFANYLFAAIFTVTKFEDLNDGKCDSDCSLREAVIAANSLKGEDTIILKKGVYYINLGNSKESDANEGNLDINDDLIIKGAGRDETIIKSLMKDRVFFIDRYHKGVKAKFSNLSIEGGESDYGGGIQNDGILILTNVRIKDNKALNGGGVFSTGYLELIKSQILENHAVTLGDKENGFGGGIFVKNGTVIKDCEFKNNFANRDGGGIYAKDKSDVKIERVNFISNGSDAKGGGVFLGGKSFINDSVFSKNSANDGGAAAFFKKSTASLINVRFFENKALGEDLGGGGAIFNFQGELSIDRSKFEGNYALGEGGGALENTGDLNISNSIFSKNSSKEHDTSNLPSNTSFGFGGAVLLISGSKVNIENVLFQNNIAANNGGAIYNDKNSILNIRDSKFISNSASLKYGGALYNEGNLYLRDTLFSKNNSKKLGGAVGLGDGESEIVACDFKYNKSYLNGGALYLSPNSKKAKIVDSLFFSNSADKFGGGVFNQASLEGDFLVFEKNEASLSGGGVYNFEDSFFNLSNSLLKSNSAKSGGGGVLNAGEMEIEDSEISYNQTKEYGGGIKCLSGSNLSVKSGLISYNTASNGAGAAVFNGGILKIYKSAIYLNEAEDFGGGILNSKSKVYITNSTFYKNRANLGGGVANNNSPSFLKLTHATFADNISNQSAFAFLNYKGRVEVLNTLIKDECQNQGEIDSLGGNVEYFHNLCGFNKEEDLNEVNENSLGDFADNGGGTYTISLNSLSKAIGQGIESECEEKDQRRYQRISCDSGAYEHSFVLSPLNVSIFKAISYDTPRLKHINRGDILHVSLKITNQNDKEAKGVVVKIPMTRGLVFKDAVISKGEIVKKSPYLKVYIPSLQKDESANITAVCEVVKRDEGKIEVKSEIFASNAKKNQKSISFRVVDFNPLEAFVKRFYKNILQRGFDLGGLNFWVGVIKTKEKTPQEAALGFFNSQEFKNKNLSDEEFVEIVYNTFFDRASDKNGREYWLKRLSKGVSRFEVVRGFTYSKEFKKLVESFGL